MITFNVISRTLHIKYKDSLGTCFTIDFEGKQYFVTAKHVVKDMNDIDNVEIFQDKIWKKYKTKLVAHSEHSDISIFVIDEYFKAYPLEPTMDKLGYGQDVYFLGFPFGLKSEVGELNQNFPMPLVKKGIVSAILFENDKTIILLDGHNNPGFSGGPVVFLTPGNPNYKVAGIVSAYRAEMVDTYMGTNPTGITAKVNTGIIIVYSIKTAIDLIKLNPIGKII